MKKLLTMVAAVLLFGAQGAVAEQAMVQGGGYSAVKKEDRALHQRHGADRAKLRKQHMTQKPTAEQLRKDWQDLNVKHHQERRAMAEKHAGKAAKGTDKSALQKEMDDMEQGHAAERKGLAEKLDKEGVNGKPRRVQFEKLHAKQREERHQLYRKHFGTAK